MLMPLLPQDVSTEKSDPAVLVLQAAALDTLGTLSTTSGDSFAQFASDSLVLTSKLVAGETDKGIRRAALTLACGVITLPDLPKEMLQAIPRLLECLLEDLMVCFIPRFERLTHFRILKVSRSNVLMMPLTAKKKSR